MVLKPKNIFKKTITCMTAAALCMTIAVPAVMADDEDVDANTSDNSEIVAEAEVDSIAVANTIEGNVVVKSDQTIENTSITGDLYIEKGVTLTLSGENTVGGSVYVFGTVNNEGTLVIDDTLYCLHFNDTMSAGDYDYGYFINTGSVQSIGMIVSDEYLDVEIPDVTDGSDETKDTDKDSNESEEESEKEEKSEAKPELTISKKSDKTDYTVNESVVYTIELGNSVEGTTATDIELTDVLPDGMHLKDVTVDGATGEITYLSETEAETEAEAESDSNSDINYDETEYTQVSHVTISTDTTDEYSFRNADTGAEYKSARTLIDPFENDEGVTQYLQTYTVWSNESGSVKVEAFSEDTDDVITIDIIFNAIDNTEDSAPQTGGEPDAIDAAKDYLAIGAFSRLGLIDQLVYEGFAEDEAEYAVDSCDVDWNEEALLCAKNYLDESAFSYQGLYDQLIYEKFTEEQASYGVDNCGADWYDQAVLKGQDYLDLYDFDSEQLIAQLEYEGFTTEQAEYADNMLLGDQSMTKGETTTETTVEGFEIKFDTLEYGESIVVTVEAYADAIGTYTNTATVESAETESVSDSCTINVLESIDTGSSTTTEGENGNNGTTTSDGNEGSGTVVTDAPKTDSAINMAVLAVMGIAACAGLAVTGVARKTKDQA